VTTATVVTAKHDGRAIYLIYRTSASPADQRKPFQRFLGSVGARLLGRVRTKTAEYPILSGFRLLGTARRRTQTWQCRNSRTKATVLNLKHKYIMAVFARSVFTVCDATADVVVVVVRSRLQHLRVVVARGDQ